MSLINIIIDQNATARQVLEDGKDIVPSWRIATPEGAYVIFTRFHHDQPEQRQRALLLISRFMAWKLATSFVLTAETLLGGGLMRGAEEAILIVGVSRHERIGLLQRIEERDPLRL